MSIHVNSNVGAAWNNFPGLLARLVEGGLDKHGRDAATSQFARDEGVVEDDRRSLVNVAKISGCRVSVSRFKPLKFDVVDDLLRHRGVVRLDEFPVTRPAYAGPSRPGDEF